jgi:hypothetical protein
VQMINETDWTLPEKVPTRSLAFKVHVPFGSKPSNTANGLFGVKLPVMPFTQKVSISPPAASSSNTVFTKLSALQPNPVAGTPGRSTKTDDVVPFGAVNVNLKSPTHGCGTLSRRTSRSVMTPLWPLTRSGILTPAELPSGIA